MYNGVIYLEEDLIPIELGEEVKRKYSLYPRNRVPEKTKNLLFEILTFVTPGEVVSFEDITRMLLERGYTYSNRRLIKSLNNLWVRQVIKKYAIPSDKYYVKNGKRRWFGVHYKFPLDILSHKSLQ